MSDESATGDIDRLLDDIRGDWRRLGETDDDLLRRRIRRQMHERFEELRRRLDGAEED